LPAIISGEAGVLAAEAITEITQGVTKNVAIIDYARKLSPDTWLVFAEGAWDMLGVPEDEGGGGLSLQDLTEVALAWGQRVLPLPLMPTIFARRWSVAARKVQGPVTYSVRESCTPSACFAGFPDVRLLLQTGHDDDGELPHARPKAPAEDFAPTLGKAPVPVATQLSPQAQHELCVLIAAEAIGCARRLLLDATDYARIREQFGQPIGKFQAVKHHLANAHVCAELAVTAVSWAVQEPEDYAVPVQLAIQDAQRSAELSLQVYGGIGFTWELGAHIFVRHLLSLRTTVDALLAGGPQ
jgi:alkylation response protein AidB-like acyl-CoA dehydrogenase